MSAYISLPPVKQMKGLTWRRKEGRKSIRFSRSPRFNLISPRHYVVLCFWVCPSLSLAVKLSDGAGLSGIDHDKRLQALSTDGGGVRWRRFAWGTRPEPRPSIMLVYLPDNGRGSVRGTERKEEGWVGGNMPLNRSIITAITYPHISQRGSHQARNNDLHLGE